jgi:membrane associated rhomboid family serine protease
LVTSAFVHANLLHLLLNAFTFYAFGFQLEALIGTPRFVQLYVFGMLVSGIVTWMRHRQDPAYATLGASGAILAVLFAFILYVPQAHLFILPIPVPIPASLFAICYLAYSVYGSQRMIGNVNHDAHLAGAMAGVVFVLLTDPSIAVKALQTFLA